jgi:protein TonB
MDRSDSFHSVNGRARIFLVTIAQAIRLLIMGNSTMAEYETLDSETLPEETQTGSVKHNSGMGPETNTPLFGRQAQRVEAIEPDVTMANDPFYESRETSAASALQDGIEIDRAFGAPIEEKSILAGLYESIRDLFFPPKLPPLELTSKPIPVPDRMAVKRNPWAVGISTTVNLAILLVVIFFLGKKILEAPKTKNLTVTPIDVETTEFKAPKKDTMSQGGGGSPDKAPAIQGKIPPRMTALNTTPKLEQPPLPSIDVAKDITIPDDSKMPNFGMAHSANVKLASGGNGTGTGLGSGHGSGYGPGTGGGVGGGLYHLGGGDTPPYAINNVEAEFSDEARRAKYQGIVEVAVIVDAQGNPLNPRVVRPLGMGLDEKALEAVRKYKFMPAKKGGKIPVAVEIVVEVDFRLY